MGCASVYLSWTVYVIIRGYFCWYAAWEMFSGERRSGLCLFIRKDDHEVPCQSRRNSEHNIFQPTIDARNGSVEQRKVHWSESSSMLLVARLQLARPTIRSTSPPGLLSAPASFLLDIAVSRIVQLQTFRSASLLQPKLSTTPSLDGSSSAERTTRHQP